MTDDVLEKLRAQYYNAIVDLQDEQHILDSLPTGEFQSFFPLMEGLISKFVEDYQELQSLADDPDVLELLEGLKMKIDICKERVESVKRQVEEDSIESQATCSMRHLIFAKTAFGSTFLQRDLKNIPHEYYDKVLSMLDTLEYGDFSSNPEKVRQLTNNKKLFGLYEIKEFNVRLIYRVLSGDMVYVMQARMKKDDNSSQDRKNLINRSRYTNDEYMELKEKVLNPHEKDLLIMEHEAIKNEILSDLKNSKRDSKGDGK